ncbi:MAG TPA: sigma-70 family RNA polymerase sigma factor [Xanthobacteraceae bacterium]|jgi:RNA polymerase sigma-70 factor, ECF subfamily|nr:sigma-70 family RNA polymerase sigma factor [Xanthobacteraceae bacterium]
MQTNRIAATADLGRTSSAKVTSDEVLVQLVADGDKDAMRALFARHNVRVFRFLTRIVGNDATAEDLLNEVFLEVWRNAGRFEARSQVSTWILAIARFKALASMRRRQHDELDDEASEMIEDTTDNPEVTVQKTERSALLQQCLQQLSVAHRQVVDLVYYHEQSIEEVAEIIGVPASTVKTRVFYARKRIAELMAERGLDRAWL